MQETIPRDLTPEQAKLRQEFFSGATEKKIQAQMDNRLAELEKASPPEKLVRRVKIGRNDICPCGSGKKFKRCCISKVRGGDMTLKDNELVLSSGNEMLQIWKSARYDGKFEFMISSGGDFPEQQLIVLNCEQFSELIDWANKIGE